MLVHEQYRKCVAFLCQPHPTQQWAPVGTAFFVAVDVGETHCVVYIVTARHVVEATRPSGPLYLRLNRHDPSGGTEYGALDPDMWFVSNDTDVAVTPLSQWATSEFDVQWLRPGQVATAAALAEKQVGPGDEVFFSGLFSSFPGVKRAEPVVRFGTISMMPNEPVPIGNADGSQSHVDAFLVEARSWGGQSGSPAFVFFPPTRHPGFVSMPDGVTADPNVPGGLLVPDSVRPLLLGLVSGHFDLRADVAFNTDIGARASVPLNTGIAVVIPAQKVIDTLMEDDLVARRKKMIEDAGLESAATPDTASAPSDSEFDQFSTLASKIVKVPKSEVDELRDNP